MLNYTYYKLLSYAEVLGVGKNINSTKIESTTMETPKITQNEGVIDLAEIRSASVTKKNCSSAKFDTFPPERDLDSMVLVFTRRKLKAREC